MKRITSERVWKKISIFSKTIRFSISSPKKACKPIFILGSGRSGTTLLFDAFNLDKRILAYNENHRKIANNYLLDYAKLDKELGKRRATHLLCKPILNSFDVRKILTRYYNSRVVWLFRDYKDVIASSAKKFGMNTANLMQETIQGKYTTNWISKGIDKDDLKIINSLDIEKFSHYDLMGLIWWAVNRTVFREKTNNEKRIKIVSYEKLVRQKKDELRSIYDFIGLEFKEPLLKFRDTSIGKGKEIILDPSVDGMCSNLQYHIKKLI